MRDSNNNSYSVVSEITLSALLVLFVALKLLGKIDWPWLWVVSPVWIPVLLVLVICVILFLVGVVLLAARKLLGPRRRR